FVFGVALTVLLACAGPLISALAPVLLILGAIALSQILLAQTGMLLSPALSVVVLISVQLMLSLLKYAREKLHSEENLRQVMASQEATIEGFCAMSEYRDPETGAHIKRTQNYVKALAECLRTHPRFKHCLNDHTIEMMYKTAPLHDVGKIGVPDYILLKPGALSEEEFEIMKKHTEYGAQVFELIQKRVGENDFLRIAIEIILGHQEKWDGSGYPRGLSGDNIPVSARLMALADVYDALISRRVYKPPFPHYQAVKMIVEGKGKHFDPDIVEAFLEIEEQFKQCALRFLDDDEQREALLREQTDHG
ncbi:MAG: HD-GYP domain-containing protein, partial [Gammaproteobacteria bacterium]